MPCGSDFDLPGACPSPFATLSIEDRVVGLIEAVIFMIAWAALLWLIWRLIKPHRKYITIWNDGDGGIDVKVDWKKIKDQRNKQDQAPPNDD